MQYSLYKHETEINNYSFLFITEEFSVCPRNFEYVGRMDRL